MKISPNKPFQVVYSLLSHECLGYLFEVFVVQLNDKGQLTWEYQTLTTRNFHEFAHCLDERDEAAPEKGHVGFFRVGGTHGFGERDVESLAGGNRQGKHPKQDIFAVENRPSLTQNAESPQGDSAS